MRSTDCVLEPEPRQLFNSSEDAAATNATTRLCVSQPAKQCDLVFQHTSTIENFRKFFIQNALVLNIHIGQSLEFVKRMRS